MALVTTWYPIIFYFSISLIYFLSSLSSNVPEFGNLTLANYNNNKNNTNNNNNSNYNNDKDDNNYSEIKNTWIMTSEVTQS